MVVNNEYHNPNKPIISNLLDSEDTFIYIQEFFEVWFRGLHWTSFFRVLGQVTEYSDYKYFCFEDENTHQNF